MRAAGFTLIEIMISMVLGIFIIGAVGSVYLGSKRTYQSRDALSLLQENGRIALFQIRQGALPGGYPAAADIEAIVHDLDQLGNATFPLSRDGPESDVVTIAFLPQRGYTEDCLGSHKTINGLVVNSFYILKKPTRDNPNRRQLMCRGAGGAQPVAESIDSLQVLYGIDTSEDSVPDQYVNATVVEKRKQWRQVVSLRVAVLANSLQKFNRADVAEKTSFDLLGVKQNVAADGRLRRVFTTTIPLRNRMSLYE